MTGHVFVVHPNSRNRKIAQKGMKTHSCTQESWRSRFPACTWSSTCPWWCSLCRTPPGRKNLQVVTKEPNRLIEQIIFFNSSRFSYRSQEVVRRRRRRHHVPVEHRGRFASSRRRSTWSKKLISIRVHLPSIFVRILLNYNEVVTQWGSMKDRTPKGVKGHHTLSEIVKFSHSMYT